MDGKSKELNQFDQLDYKELMQMLLGERFTVYSKKVEDGSEFYLFKIYIKDNNGIFPERVFTENLSNKSDASVENNIWKEAISKYLIASVMVMGTSAIINKILSDD